MLTALLKGPQKKKRIPVSGEVVCSTDRAFIRSAKQRRNGTEKQKLNVMQRNAGHAVWCRSLETQQSELSLRNMNLRCEQRFKMLFYSNTSTPLSNVNIYFIT
jgi:hypothetical protein